MNSSGNLRRLPIKLAASLLLIAGLIHLDAFAREDPGEPPVPATVIASASGAPAGGDIVIAYVLDVPADHHVTDKSYGLYYWEPTLPDGFSITDTTWPLGEMDKGEEIYRGRAVVKYVLHAGDSVAPADYTIPYNYGYQICRELPPEKCYLPNGGDGNLVLSVLAPGAMPIPSGDPLFNHAEDASAAESSETVTGDKHGSLENRLTSALENGNLVAFLLVFVAGFLISLTPCVYPMIPIIIGFVGGSAGGSRMKGFILSLFFVLGMAVVYAVLGVIAGLTGALFGAFMQNPIVLWFIVAVFVALGASMLGAFDITVPSSVQDKLMSGERTGILGAILIGGITGIVAAPCAGPPLLVLLSWIGNSGNVVLGFLYMATLALGLGVLFIVLGTSTAAMTSLPQAGAWMDKIKKGLGLAIFGVALYYLHLLLNTDVFHLILGGSLVLLGLYIGATKKWDELAGYGKLGKGLGYISVIAGVFYVVLGLAGINGVNLSGGFTAASGAALEQAEENRVPWNVNTYDEVMMQASREGRPVLIDFYADWCGVCVELDHKVWNQQSVIAAVNNSCIPLKLDFTRSTPELEALRKKHNIGGLPTVIILGPGGSERARFNSVMEPAEVIAWLKEHTGA